MRLIDADALLEILSIKFGNMLPNVLLKEINNAPTVEINTNDIEYKAYCKGVKDGKKIADMRDKETDFSELLRKYEG